MFVYKSVNNIMYSPINFVTRDLRAYNIRNPPALIVPHTRSTQTSRFIHVRGAIWWNELNEEIRNSRSVYIFKRKLKTMYFESYN